MHRQNVRRVKISGEINVRRHNGRRHNVCGTKRPEEQNVQKDKTLGRTKRPEGQNVRKVKTSGDKTPFWLTFNTDYTHYKLKKTTRY